MKWWLELVDVESVGFGLLGLDSGFGVGVATSRARGDSRWLEGLAGSGGWSSGMWFPVFRGREWLVMEQSRRW